MHLFFLTDIPSVFGNFMKQYQFGLGMEKSPGISLPKKFFLLGNISDGSVSNDHPTMELKKEKLSPISQPRGICVPNEKKYFTDWEISSATWSCSIKCAIQWSIDQ